jgi:ABC-2 type transport system permease protein
MSQAQLVAQPVREDQQSVFAAPSVGMIRPALSLAQRELVRFLRQRHRIIGALATPIVFWLLIGGGMGRSISFGGNAAESYIRFFFPGTLVMILLFTAIFSTISIIEDRREGFLQSVLVTPIPRQTIVLGKVLGGTVLASGQGLIFLLLAPLVGVHFTVGSFLLCVLLMIVISFALTALGFCIAWRMSSTQGFHAIMNLFLMPMWFLSGALFPARADTWAPLKWAMRVNPLTYGLAGLRRAMYVGQASATGAQPSWTMCLGVSVIYALAMFALCSAIARGRLDADLQ